MKINVKRLKEKHQEFQSKWKGATKLKSNNKEFGRYTTNITNMLPSTSQRIMLGGVESVKTRSKEVIRPGNLELQENVLKN